jgi:hypothetical protein
MMIHHGQECRVSFLLVPFLWTSKEKILVHEGRKTHINSRIKLKNNTCHAPAQEKPIRPKRTKHQNNA